MVQMYRCYGIQQFFLQRQVDVYIVVGKVGYQFGFFVLFKEYCMVGVGKLFIEVLVFFIVQDGEYFVVVVVFFYIYMIGVFIGGCVGLFVVGEYMQVGNIKFVQEVVGFKEVFFCFIGEVYDYVYFNIVVWYEGFDCSYVVGVQFVFVVVVYFVELFVVV